MIPFPNKIICTQHNNVPKRLFPVPTAFTELHLHGPLPLSSPPCMVYRSLKMNLDKTKLFILSSAQLNFRCSIGYIKWLFSPLFLLDSSSPLRVSEIFLKSLQLCHTYYSLEHIKLFKFSPSFLFLHSNFHHLHFIFLNLRLYYVTPSLFGKKKKKFLKSPLSWEISITLLLGL